MNNTQQSAAEYIKGILDENAALKRDMERRQGMKRFDVLLRFLIVMSNKGDDGFARFKGMEDLGIKHDNETVTNILLGKGYLDGKPVKIDCFIEGKGIEYSVNNQPLTAEIMNRIEVIN